MQFYQDFKEIIGGFGSLYDISHFKMKDPVIVSSTDGVGTKIELANKFKKFDTIGIDLVAMCVNDLVVQGANPYLFLDYISINKINLNKLQNILKGIVKGCKIANCKLVGGETAEMPGTYSKGKFDIAGFAVGLVEKKKILNKKIRNKDLILAIPSNGLHSNGFSLVRYLLKKKKINLKSNKFLREELIRPTKIYVKEISYLNKKNLINGCANITGGGLVDNIKRIIPKNLSAEINLNNINRSLSGLSDSVKSATQKSDQISDNIKDRNLLTPEPNAGVSELLPKPVILTPPSSKPAPKEALTLILVSSKLGVADQTCNLVPWSAV